MGMTDVGGRNPGERAQLLADLLTEHERTSPAWSRMLSTDEASVLWEHRDALAALVAQQQAKERVGHPASLLGQHEDAALAAWKERAEGLEAQLQALRDAAAIYLERSRPMRGWAKARDRLAALSVVGPPGGDSGG